MNQQIEELVKATLIMGCRRGNDSLNHDTALELVQQSIPSMTKRFAGLLNAHAQRDEVDGLKAERLRDRLSAEVTELQAEVDRMKAALTPSAETKGAYVGEFYFESQGDKHMVPWTTIKTIMAVIKAHALSEK